MAQRENLDSVALPRSLPRAALVSLLESLESQLLSLESLLLLPVFTSLICCIDNLPALLTSSTPIVPHPSASHRLPCHRVRDKHNHPRNVPIRPTNPPASHQACASGEGKHTSLAMKRVIVASTADHIHDVEVVRTPQLFFAEVVESIACTVVSRTRFDM